MTDLLAASPEPETATRERARLHFTAPSGWLNDPHGICWADAKYHLFYQANPVAPQWSAKCHWGHAISTDLIRWQHRPIALAPRQDEEGCWSGSTIVENGQPTIFYTSVLAEDLGHGRIATAFPDPTSTHWTSTAEDILIDGPPPELGAHNFRDPCIFATSTGWTMIVGVGVGGGTAMAVQYTSTDARHWSYTGVLCSRPGSDTAGAWTGAAWECPQLIQIGAEWALLVSVWQDDILHYVAGAVGTYDGRTFTPERWSRLTYDDSAYAMTSFRDNQNRPCVMSWLREAPDHDPTSRPWASSLSLPALVTIGPGRTLELQPHPDLFTLRTQPVVDTALTPGSTVQVANATDGTDLDITLAAGHRTEITLDGPSRPAVRIIADTRTQSVLVERPHHPTVTVPMPSTVLRIILDTDLVEIYGGNGSASFRIPAAGTGTLTIEGTAGQVHGYELRNR